MSFLAEWQVPGVLTTTPLSIHHTHSIVPLVGLSKQWLEKKKHRSSVSDVPSHLVNTFLHNNMNNQAQYHCP